MSTPRSTAEKLLVPKMISGGAYHTLLGLLVIMYAIGPWLVGAGGALVSTVVWIALLMSAMGAVAGTRKSLLIGSLVLPILMVIGLVADRLAGTGIIIDTTFRSLATLFILVVITWRVFTQRRVTDQTISGSICIYLLIGVLWSTLYQLVEYIDPGSFRGLPDVAGLELETMHHKVAAALFYYSHVTLTTLGFGDVVPVTRVARSLSTLEAMAGQIYLVVAVARLVALHVAEASPPHEVSGE